MYIPLYAINEPVQAVTPQAPRGLHVQPILNSQPNSKRPFSQVCDQEDDEDNALLNIIKLNEVKNKITKET